MNIAFVWYWDRASKFMPKWRDGLRSAMEIVGKKHDVDWFLDKEIPQKKYDFLLFWDDSNSEMFNHLDLGERKGICLSTFPTNVDNIKKLDVVFCESQPIYDFVRAQGVRAIKAFGTDTEFFSPSKATKTLDFFYPATFSPWKRQSEIAYLGKQLLCVGTLQPDGQDELDACKEMGVQLKIGYFSPKKIRDYYRSAKNVIIPAVHGSERTVLEAMSTNILPIIVHPEENTRANSYLEEYGNSPYDNPRDFVLNNYSHFIYADQLLKGIE